MKKIKVIQISSTSSSFFLNSGKGNAETIINDDWFAQVAKEIKKFSPRIEIECWAPERSYKKEIQKENAGVRFRLFPTLVSIRPGMELSFEMIRAIKKEIKLAEKEGKRLILHFHEYHSWQAYLLLSSINSENINIIAQHHGGRSPLKNLKKYKRAAIVLPLIMLMQFFEDLLLKKIDCFYALSDEEINYLKKRVNGKIKFQTMGIGKEFFKKQDKENSRKKMGLEKGKKYILYIGRLKTTKGIKELLDAMEILNKENIELLLIGRGPDFEVFRKYAQQRNIKNVKFLGAIYGDNRIEYFDAVDFLILPSYTEGAPVVLMEAIARNLPVIASDVGGVSNMIENYREGIIIKPKSSEEIIKAIKEILTWKKKNIKKYAARYKWREIINSTLEDYKELSKEN